MPAKQEMLIEKVIFGGSGLGRLDGKVCLVNDVIEGEVAEVRVRQEKKGFSRGKLIKVTKTSPERIVPACRYIKQCGGCQYQHMTYREQLRTKELQVRESVTHGLKLPGELIQPIRSSPVEYYYRNHVTLHPLHPKSRDPQQMGYVGRDHQSIVTVEECVIADPRLKPVFNSQIPIESDRERVTFWLSEKGEILSDLYPAFFKIKICGRQVTAHSQSFFQNNIAVTELVVAEIRKLVERSQPEVFIDLYSGMGLFSLLAAESVPQLFCIEENPNSLRAFRENFSGTEKKLNVFEGRVERVFPRRFEEVAGQKVMVVLDPPRTGLEPGLARFLSEQPNIRDLVYLACDLPTMVRDLKLILEQGRYRVKSFLPFDMFPQTKHIEVLAVLENNESA